MISTQVKAVKSGIISASYSLQKYLVVGLDVQFDLLPGKCSDSGRGDLPLAAASNADRKHDLLD